MEDKRVIKTRQNLKCHLTEMLYKKSFEQITVKELCEVSKTSRITFYVHYTDKYDIVDDIAKDMIKNAKQEYTRLQSINNRAGDCIMSYCNLLDCILTVYYENMQLFSHTVALENTYLNFLFNKYILYYLEIHAEKKSKYLKPKYSLKKISSFLCYGLWGFISTSHIENYTADQVKTEAKKILEAVLRAEVLTKNCEPYTY